MNGNSIESSPVHARELIHFWQVSFKVQVETRTGTIRLHEHGDCEIIPSDSLIVIPCSSTPVET